MKELCARIKKWVRVRRMAILRDATDCFDFSRKKLCNKDTVNFTFISTSDELRANWIRQIVCSCALQSALQKNINHTKTEKQQLMVRCLRLTVHSCWTMTWQNLKQQRYRHEYEAFEIKQFISEPKLAGFSSVWKNDSTNTFSANIHRSALFLFCSNSRSLSNFWITLFTHYWMVSIATSYWIKLRTFIAFTLLFTLLLIDFKN